MARPYACGCSCRRVRPCRACLACPLRGACGIITLCPPYALPVFFCALPVLCAARRRYTLCPLLLLFLPWPPLARGRWPSLLSALAVCGSSCGAVRRALFPALSASPRLRRALPLPVLRVAGRRVLACRFASLVAGCPCRFLSRCQSRARCGLAALSARTGCAGLWPHLARPGWCLMRKGSFDFRDYSAIGFSGSRALRGPQWVQARSLAARAARVSAVLVGCARGADAAARAGAPDAIVFRAASSAPRDLVARSIQMVSVLSGSPSPLLVALPGRPCPAGVRVAARWQSCGSGSWSTIALALGRGCPVYVIGAYWPAAWPVLATSAPAPLPAGALLWPNQPTQSTLI